MSKRIKTNKTGIYYRESIVNNKREKTYYITYKDENNKTKEKKIGKESEGFSLKYCVAIRNKIITSIRFGDEAPSIVKNKKTTQVSLDTIQELYFKKRKEGESKQSDLSTFGKHLEPFFRNKNLETIKKEDIKKLHEKIKKAKNRFRKPLATKTVNNILTILKSITSFALKEELLKNDFRNYIELDSVRNIRDRYLNIEEINQLYKEIKNDDRLFLFSKIALTTGARLASILYISKKDIDFSNQLITLHDLKKDQDGRATYKGFLTEEVTALLKDHCRLLKPMDKIFNNNPSTIQKQMLYIINELFNQGLEIDDRKNRAVIHTLRHTFASHLAINGTPIFTIQKLMNHSDINMTLRYAKLSPDRGKDAIMNLNF